MNLCSRRSLLAVLGAWIPAGLGAGVRSGTEVATTATAPSLRFRSFEEALREALASPRSSGGAPPVYRIEIGHSEAVSAGLQGCHNDRPFAGVPAGALRIVRMGSEPGPVVGGLRLYVRTVDVALTSPGDRHPGTRPLDFETLPPAPVLTIDHARVRT